MVTQRRQLDSVTPEMKLKKEHIYKKKHRSSLGNNKKKPIYKVLASIHTIVWFYLGFRHYS